MMALFLAPLLFLPGRVFSAYCYLPFAGLAIALIISILLAAQFLPKLVRTGKVMPAGVMSVLSVIGIIAAIVAWVRK